MSAFDKMMQEYRKKMLRKVSQVQREITVSLRMEVDTVRPIQSFDPVVSSRRRLQSLLGYQRTMRKITRLTRPKDPVQSLLNQQQKKNFIEKARRVVQRVLFENLNEK